MVTHLIVCFVFNCFVSFGCLVFCNGGIVAGLVWCCWFLGCLGIVCYYDLRVLRWCGLIVLVVVICLCGFGFRGFGWIVFLVCGINCGLFIRFWYDAVLSCGVRLVFGMLSVCWYFVVGCVF